MGGILGLLLAFTWNAGAVTIEELLEQSERPTMEQVSSLEPMDIWQIYGAKAFERDEKQENIIKAFPAIIESIQTKYKDHEVYILGRDGEPLYDALWATSDARERSRLHLVQLSRPVIADTEPSTILKYLGKHNLDFEKIVNGRQSVLFLDTGYSGTIFRGLLRIFVDEISSRDSNRDRKAKKLLEGVEFRLLASENPIDSKYLRLRKDKLGLKELKKEIESDDELYFPTLLNRKSTIPRDPHSAWRWVIDNLEYTPKWTNRAAEVMANGQVRFSKTADWNALVDKKEYLRRMIVLAQAFSNPEWKSSSRRRVIEIKPGLRLHPGQIVITEGLDPLEVIEFVEMGLRGRVYKVKDIDGELFALKIAVDDDAETINSIQGDVEKAKEYKTLGIPHAEIVEQTSTYVLKRWVEGQRADEWVERWAKSGSRSDAKARLELNRLIRNLSKKSAYVGDLNPKNLIWTGDKWVVVDSGSVRHDLTAKKTFERYQEKINDRWMRDQKANCAVLLGDY